MGACWSRPVGDAAGAVPAAPACSAHGAPSVAIGQPALACLAPLDATAVVALQPVKAAPTAVDHALSTVQALHAAPCLIEPNGEEERLRAVRALHLIGATPQPKFEAITALMKQMFETPVAAVTLIDTELHFISRAGDWACGAGRAGSFCDWILVPPNPQMLIVENAAEDIRFKNNQFVEAEPYIRFYAGAPLVSSYEAGHRYGTLCVFDFKPRRFDAAKYAMLAHFAEIVVREMERELAMMLQQREMGRAKSAENHLLRAIESFHEGIVLLDLSTTTWSVLYANDAFRHIVGMPQLLLGSGSRPATPINFWQMFGHVTNGNDDSYSAAMLAMATGRDFTMKVRMLCGGDGGEHVLTVAFRPADSEQLRLDMPHIGIPAWIDGAQAAEAEDGADRDHTCSIILPETSGGSVDLLRANVMPRPNRPMYYFGLVKASDRMSVGATRTASNASTASVAVPDGMTPSAFATEQVQQAPSSAELASQVESRILPSFIQMRPEVMQEVQLGPLIGTGSMGRCYRGTWQGGRVAVKIIDCWEPTPGALHPVITSSAEAASQGTQAAVVEALLARSLSHPHIVTTFTHGMSTEELRDAGKRHHQVWIVQEYCNRGALQDAVDSGSLHTPEGGPNLQYILLAAQEIAGACAYLHGHDVIHGDLSPSNVLLTSATKDARRWICKVCDFGLARHSGGAKELQSSSFGTVTYMPPELLSVGKLSKAADVYSFGIILLEMYYGRRAWLGTPPVRILAKVSAGMLPFEIPSAAPPALASLMRRCLDLDPDNRPSFAAILQEVQEIARGLAPPYPPSQASNADVRHATPLNSGGSQQRLRSSSQSPAPRPAAAGLGQQGPTSPVRWQLPQKQPHAVASAPPAMLSVTASHPGGGGSRVSAALSPAGSGITSPFAVAAASRAASAVVSPFASPMLPSSPQ